jgi:hypothetical protein
MPPITPAITSRLVAVYNANGGVVGELAYVIGHVLGRVDCALCDITHSPIRKKSEWKNLVDELLENHGCELVARHKNELTEHQRQVSAGFEPCVLLEKSDGTYDIVMSATDLRQCDGDVGRFGEAAGKILHADQ